MRRHYEAGHLPNAGGLAEQPAALLDQLRIIESEMAEIDKERSSKAE